MTARKPEQLVAVAPNPNELEKYLASEGNLLLSLKRNKNCKGKALTALICHTAATLRFTNIVFGDAVHVYNMEAMYPGTNESDKQLRDQEYKALCDDYWSKNLKYILRAINIISQEEKKVITKEEISELYLKLVTPRGLDDEKINILNAFLVQHKINIKFYRYNSFMHPWYVANKGKLKEKARSLKAISDRLKTEAMNFVDSHFPEYRSGLETGEPEWQNERARLVGLEEEFFLEETLGFTTTAVLRGIDYSFYPGTLAILEFVTNRFCNANSKGILRESELNRDFFSDFTGKKEPHCVHLKLKYFESLEKYKEEWKGKTPSFYPLISESSTNRIHTSGDLLSRSSSSEDNSDSSDKNDHETDTQTASQQASNNDIPKSPSEPIPGRKKSTSDPVKKSAQEVIDATYSVSAPDSRELSLKSNPPSIDNQTEKAKKLPSDEKSKRDHHKKSMQKGTANSQSTAQTTVLNPNDLAPQQIKSFQALGAMMAGAAGAGKQLLLPTGRAQLKALRDTVTFFLTPEQRKDELPTQSGDHSTDIPAFSLAPTELSSTES